jgi:ATPase family associated with various cellular activities (AAA)
VTEVLPVTVAETARLGERILAEVEQVVMGKGEAVFRPGPVFTGLLLADEINRTPPKTQAALLEAMAEGQVSADGVTRPLPQPFVVLATDNPIEYEGTYPLPEAQLDRFTARVRLGYPAHGDRQFYQIAELLLQARYDSWVTPDLDRIPRTALPPGTLVVALSPLLDPRGLAALTDLRRRGFPLIVVDTLRDEPPAGPRPAGAGLALRLWRVDRAATRSALRGLGVPVLRWDAGAELDSVLAPLRRPPPGARRPAARS